MTALSRCLSCRLVWATPELFLEHVRNGSCRKTREDFAAGSNATKPPGTGEPVPARRPTHSRPSK